MNDLEVLTDSNPRQAQLLHLGIAWDWDAPHSDPRFQELICRINFLSPFATETSIQHGRDTTARADTSSLVSHAFLVHGSLIHWL